MVNRGKLRAELTKVIYDGIGHQPAADMITLEDKTLPAPPVATDRIYQLIDDGEFRGLSADQREEIRDIYRSSEEVDVNSSRARSLLVSLFGAGTTTRAALATLATPVPASTADIEGLGEVRGSDVEKARFMP